MFANLIAHLGMAQGQQSLPGVKSDPFGSFSHFMGATNANINDPLNIFGQSGSNPVKNFLNPGGATLIPGLTPSNRPLPGGEGAAGGALPFNLQNTGLQAGQLRPMDMAFNNYLRAIGQPRMPMPGQGQPRPVSPQAGPGAGGGMGAGGSINPQHLQMLMQLGGQRRPM